MTRPGMKVAGGLRSILMVGVPLVMVGLLSGKPKPIKVTGCLQKGTTESEFILTTKRGKKYEVESTSLGLAGHVGHTVTIQGSFQRQHEEKGETKAKQQMENKTGEAQHDKNLAGHVEATSLTMVSATCP